MKKLKYRVRLMLASLVALLWVLPATAQIYWQNNQFVIDANRPAWQGAVANLNVGPGQSRDHVIAFEVIQNDLAVKLSGLVQGGMAQTAVNNLVALTDALFINGPANEVQAMQQARNNLLTALQNGATNTYQTLAQTLLGLLNSSSANVRVGDAALNASIGYSIDAEFQPGLHAYNGFVLTPNGQTNFAGQVLLLNAHSNAIVYRYQMASGLALSFVVNGIGGALNPAAPNAVQLSSTQLPQIPQMQLPATLSPQNPQPYPVLVVDPAGNQLPLRYW